MVVPGNAGKGRSMKRWRDVVEDDLKKAALIEGQREMKGSNNVEGVRPVRARKNAGKMRTERENFLIIRGSSISS